MPYRLTKIYTRKGDEGFTHLGKNKVSKDDTLIHALGDLDELNAHLGVLTTLDIHPDVLTFLRDQQNQLFNIGGELSTPGFVSIQDQAITSLEEKLDAWNQNLPPLTEFILPGGNQASAFTHVARTVCRRAERTLASLQHEKKLENKNILRYINRLSDVLFVLARVFARSTTATEPMWQHDEKT